MKLATYKDGSRDGQLVVVSRDLGSAHFATHIATRLQQVLDDWNFLAPQLQDLTTTLNHGKARHAFPFDPRMCMAPLPRAYQWVSSAPRSDPADAAAVAQPGAAPNSAAATPLMHQGSGDSFIGACDPVLLPSEELGIDFEPGIAAITGDLPLGATPDMALDGIRLLMLANRVHLRHLLAAERAQGAGGLQSQPVTAFSPVAVTPDELGQDWRDGRVQLSLQSRCNGRLAGPCAARSDEAFHLGQLIAHIAQTRRVRAGTVVGAGAVCNPGLPVHDQPGSGCMRFGDTIRVELMGRDGSGLLGAIDQTVAPSAPGA